MQPSLFLLSMVAITVVARLAYRAQRRRRSTALRAMAETWQMRYVQQDLFHLAPRVAGSFPIIEISNLHIRDVIYGSQKDQHRYVFTAEYTLGPEDNYRREARVMSFCESRESGPAAKPPTVEAAPEELPILEQYAHFGRMMGGPE